MSSSPPMADSGKFTTAAAAAAGGVVAKMTFSQTCNLLSQYVKEKRARGTMNLFPANGKSEDSNGGCVGRTINLFPLMPSSCVSKPASPDSSGAQMTIFYGGQVIVLNDLVSDKAKEVIDLATSLELSVKKRKVETASSVPSSPAPVPVPAPNANQNHNSSSVVPNCGSSVISATMPQPAVPNVSGNYPPATSSVISATMPQPAVPNVSDLPIARKASLHRFLEKRKDRIVGKAPSSSDVPSASRGSSKPAAEGQSWLGLGPLPVFQPQQQN